MYTIMNSRRSLRSGALAALLVALAGCVTVPPPDVFVVNLEPLEGGGIEQRVKVDLRVQNASNQPISAAGISLKLIVNDQPLARGVSNEHFTVPPLGEATTSVVTSTTLIDLLRQAYGVQGRTSFDYRLEGKLYLEGPPGGSVSFESRGTLAPPAVQQ